VYCYKVIRQRLIEFLNSLKQVKANARYYPAWQQQEAMKEAVQQQVLHENPPSKAEKRKAIEEARLLVDNINTMDTYGVNKEEKELEDPNKMLIAPTLPLVNNQQQHNAEDVA